MSPTDPFGLESTHCFIAGRWKPSNSTETMPLLNPSTGEPLCFVAKANAVDIDHAVDAANTAMQLGWGRASADDRGRVLKKLAVLVLKHLDLLAEIEALDVGKPLKQARADAIALARYCDFYASATEKLQAQTNMAKDGSKVQILRDPQGVTGHLVAWNYPMQLIGRSVCAALAAGNACVVKPSEEACLGVLVFAELAARAGLPSGVLNVLPGLDSELNAVLFSHHGIQHQDPRLQPYPYQRLSTIPEQTGKSAQIVFEDADLDAAMGFLVNAGIQNAGQSSTTASRIFVQKGVCQRLTGMLIERYAQLQVGPAINDLDVGPLISAEQQESFKESLELGADLNNAATGSLNESASGNGFYGLPTLFADVSPQHKLARQDVFGPLQLVIPFEDEDEVLSVNNELGHRPALSVWTSNTERQMRMANALRAVQVLVNDYVASEDVELPFESVKRSGHGREKGFEALFGYTNLKTVSIPNQNH